MFLNGLNESYFTLRSQIILIEPFHNLNKAYNLVLREESQRKLLIQSQPLLESISMLVITDGKRKRRPDVICAYYGKKGHSKRKCYKLIGFLEDFKFNKSKNSLKKRNPNHFGRKSMNSIMTTNDSHMIKMRIQALTPCLRYLLQGLSFKNYLLSSKK